jgi:ribosomal protein S6--L-glutamate ligase
MILSFHPIIEADKNIICAGRLPDDNDQAAIRLADAVILPQGCSEALYRMARSHCPHIFPNMDIRFAYPGKRGQIRLFREKGLAHPRTDLYADLGHFESQSADLVLPVVIKLDFGGQGDTVFKAGSADEMALALERVKACERTGQKGFLVQQFIPTRDRSLRIAVIGQWRIAYWRIAPGRFGTSVSRGAVLDHEADPHLQQAALTVVNAFCQKTHLQLGGFDIIFSADDLNAGHVAPLALEINYFFGRAGLGGSEAYYRILEQETRNWLSELGLKAREGKNRATDTL